MHQFLKFIFGIKLYMFRTAPLSIISSFSLYTQQWRMSANLSCFFLLFYYETFFLSINILKVPFRYPSRNARFFQVIFLSISDRKQNVIKKFSPSQFWSYSVIRLEGLEKSTKNLAVTTQSLSGSSPKTKEPADISGIWLILYEMEGNTSVPFILSLSTTASPHRRPTSPNT